MPSGSTTYILADGGSFTPPSGVDNIKWQDVQDQATNPPVDVTGYCASTMDTDRVFIQGVTSNEFLASGVVMNGSCTSYGLAQSMAYTLTGGVKIKVSQWTLRKGWLLQPVHNGADEEFVAARPVIQVSANGWAIDAAGPGMTTKTLTALTLDINGFGSIACKSGGSAIIGSITQYPNFRDAGAVACAFSALYSGGVDYTGTTFSWLFPTPDRPIKGTATLITGQTRTNSALAYDFTFSNISQQGGSIGVQARFKWDKA
jgi:hypothetical protein